MSISGTVNGVQNPGYRYDADGNLTCEYTGPNCSHGAITKETDAYWSFNMTHTISDGATSLTLTYDSEHARITQLLTTASTNVTTNYLNDPVSGAVAEKVVSGSTNTWNDYLMADGKLVGERICSAPTPSCPATSASWQYFILDHLGSVSVVTDGTTKLVTARESFDAWGKQRNADWSDNATCSSGLTAPTTRGFTSQEDIASLCLVNLNARLYDPSIGRFLSADSFIADPTDPQAYNRYTYVNNRPLSLTDPTGHVGDTPFGWQPGEPFDAPLPPGSYPGASCDGPGCGVTFSGFEIAGIVVITAVKYGLNTNGEMAPGNSSCSGGNCEGLSGTDISHSTGDDGEPSEKPRSESPYDSTPIFWLYAANTNSVTADNDTSTKSDPDGASSSGGNDLYLSYVTKQGAQNTRDWKVKFILSDEVRQGGYIIQEVRIDETITDAEGHTGTRPFHFWEAWRVPMGSDRSYSGVVPFDDTFGLSDPKAGYSVHDEIWSSAIFYRGMTDLSDDFVPNNPQTKGWAAPSTIYQPNIPLQGTAPLIRTDEFTWTMDR
jgi:RHS repeat-associated protein